MLLTVTYNPVKENDCDTLCPKVELRIAEFALLGNDHYCGMYLA